ncbi:hypothetical protein ACWDUL_21200 [Nocardia niigatensis]
MTEPATDTPRSWEQVQPGNWIRTGWGAQHRVREVTADHVVLVDHKAGDRAPKARTDLDADETLHCSSCARIPDLGPPRGSVVGEVRRTPEGWIAVRSAEYNYLRWHFIGDRPDEQQLPGTGPGWSPDWFMENAEPIAVIPDSPAHHQLAVTAPDDAALVAAAVGGEEAPLCGQVRRRDGFTAVNVGSTRWLCVGAHPLGSYGWLPHTYLAAAPIVAVIPGTPAAGATHHPRHHLTHTRALERDHENDQRTLALTARGPGPDLTIGAHAQARLIEDQGGPRAFTGYDVEILGVTGNFARVRFLDPPPHLLPGLGATRIYARTALTPEPEPDGTGRLEHLAAATAAMPPTTATPPAAPTTTAARPDPAPHPGPGPGPGPEPAASSLF